MKAITAQDVRDQRERVNSADATYAVQKDVADAAAHSAMNQRLAFESLMETLAEVYIPTHSDGIVVIDDIAVVQVFTDTDDSSYKTVKILPVFYLDGEV